MKKRLIDFDLIRSKAFADPDSGEAIVYLQDIDEISAVDAVEVVRIEKVKNEILEKMDEFIWMYRSLSLSPIDHFGGKVDAMETARRLVNAALTDLCFHEERKEC